MIRSTFQFHLRSSSFSLRQQKKRKLNILIGFSPEPKSSFASLLLNPRIQSVILLINDHNLCDNRYLLL